MQVSSEFGIRLTVDGNNATAALGRFRGEVESVGASARQAAADTVTLSGQMDRLVGATTRLAGVAFGAGLAREAIQAADAMTNLASRTRLVTDTLADAGVAQLRLREIALATRQSIDSIGEVYFKVAKGAETLNLSQARVFALTQTIAQAMTLSGSASESARAALVQFGQALSSGTLRGEELNSVLEQAPALADAIAKGLGKTVGELRTLGAAGKLTVAELVSALEKQAPEVARQFSQIAPTVASSFTNLKTVVTGYIGDTDQATGATRVLAGGIQTVADNFGALATGGLVVAEVALARWVATQAASVAASYQRVAAGREEVLAARENAVATAAATAAKAEEIAANIAFARAAQAAAAAQLQSANAAYAAAAANGANSYALRVAREAELSRAAAMAELAALGRAQATMQAELTVATTANAAAQTAAATATRNAALGVGVARGALAALGGPIGAVTTVLMLGATAWSIWGGSAQSAAAEEAAAMRDVQDEATKTGKAELEIARARRDWAREKWDLDGRGASSAARAEWAKWDQTVQDIEQRQAAVQKRMAAANIGEAWTKLHQTKIEKYREQIVELDKAYATESAKFVGSQEKQLQLAREYQTKRAEIEKLNKPSAGVANDAAQALSAQISTVREAAKAEVDIIREKVRSQQMLEVDAINATLDVQQRAASQTEALLARKYSATKDKGEQAAILGEMQRVANELGKAYTEADAQALEFERKWAESRARVLDSVSKDVNVNESALDKAASDFVARYRQAIAEAVRYGDQETLDQIASAAEAVMSRAGFEDAKRQWESLYSAFQADLQDIRGHLEGLDGKSLPELLKADEAERALRAKFLPQLRVAADEMKELAGDNPELAKAASNAARNLSKITEEITPLQKTQAEAWVNFCGDIQRGLTDSLYRGFESGKGGAQSFMDGVKNLFKTSILKVGVQFVSSEITGLVTSTMGGLYNAVVGSPSGASSGQGAGGASGSSGSSAMSNMLINQGLSQAANWGMSSVGGLRGLYGSFAASSMGQSLGLASAAEFVGPQTAAAISGAAAESVVLTPLGSKIGAAIPYIGIAIALASMMGLFSSDVENPQFTPYYGGSGSALPGLSYTGKTGTYGFSQADSSAWASTTMKYVESLDKTAAALVNNDPTKLSGIREAVAAITQRSDGQPLQWAFPQLDEGSSKEVATEFGKNIIGAALDQINGGLGDYVRQLGVHDYDKVLEVAAQFSTLTAVFKGMGRDASDLSKALIEASGGLDTLASEAGAYYTAYYSDTERGAAQRQTLQTQVDDAFAELQLPIPATKEAFRKLVDSLDLTTEAGQQTYAQLMHISATFSTLADQATQVDAAYRQAIWSSADNTAYDRNTARDQVSAAFDQLGLAVPATKEQFKALVESIDTTTQAGRDLALAIEQIAPAFAQLETSTQSLQAAYVQSYYSAQEQAAMQTATLNAQIAATFAQLGLAVPPTKAAFRALVDSIDVSTAAGQQMRDQLLLIASTFATVADSVSAAVAGINNTVASIQYSLLDNSGKETATFDAANQLLSGYGLSVTPEQWPQLTDAQAYDFVTQVGKYAADTGDTKMASDLQALANLYSQSKQLRAQGQTVSVTVPDVPSAGGGGYDNLTNSANQAADALVALVDSLRSFEQSLVQGGLSALSPEEKYRLATQEFESVAAAAKAGDQTAAGQLQEAGSAFLEASKAYNGANSQYAADFSKLLTALDGWTGLGLAAQVKKVPAFAEGGYHAGGLRLVGERGPELEMTGSARYWTATQTRDLLTGGGRQSDDTAAPVLLRIADSLDRIADLDEAVGSGVWQRLSALVAGQEELLRTGRATARRSLQ